MKFPSDRRKGIIFIFTFGSLLAAAIIALSTCSDTPVTQETETPNSPLPELVRIADLTPISAVLPDSKIKPVPLAPSIEQRVGDDGHTTLIFRVNDVTFDAALAKGVRLKTVGAAKTFSISWTTTNGAETNFVPQKATGNGDSAELILDQNPNWRETVTSLTITCENSDKAFAVDQLELIPAEITGAPSRIRVDRMVGDCIAQNAPCQYVYQITTPHSPVLSFGARVFSGTILSEASAIFEVSLKLAGRTHWQKVFEETLSSTEPMQFHEVSLNDFAGGQTQIKLQARPLEGSPLAIWHNPFVYSRQQAPKHFVLYIVDALRADHLEPYGYEKSTSPNIVALATDGTLFQRAYAQAPWTRPAYASLITSLYPETHGVKNSMEIPEKLADDIITLAEVFRDNGYLTAGFIVNGFAQSYFGMDQGLDLSFEYPSKFPMIPYYVNVGEVTDDILRWVDRYSNVPWFLTVFVVDPHEPYVPPAEYCEPYGCERPIEHYDAEIKFVDDYFGKFIDRLKSRRIYKDTTICFTADHGEEFGEHGGYYHGNTLYEEVIHIPLLLKTSIAPGGGTVEQLVEQVDIAPTLVSLAGLQPPAEWQGRNLEPLLINDGRPPQEKPVFACLHRSVFPSDSEETAAGSEKKTTRSIYSVRKGNLKLIETREGESAPEWQLFDLSKDMQEKNSVALTHPLRFIDLYLTLKKLKKNCRRKAFDSTPVTREISQEEINRLKAIGYLQ